MSKDGARESQQVEPLEQQLAAIAAQFAEIAAAIERGRSDKGVAEAFTQIQNACGTAGKRSSGSQTLLANMTTAVETWRTVWPRLGHQREFRQAVVREANMWARRFEELAKSTARS